MTMSFWDILCRSEMPALLERKEIRESDGQRQAGKTRLLSDAPLIAGGGDPVVPVQPFQFPKLVCASHGIFSVEDFLVYDLYWPSKHWFRMNECAGYLVKKLAYEHNLAVLVMNHTGDGLGDSWKSIPHSRLFFSCDRGSNDRGCKLLVGADEQSQMGVLYHL
ncbi:hypothetical protein V6N12_071742 [Hibiscus sabdariffa]|uniref:Uncharacterized protein n=1 Tax=Hibiscus sabdariffa TaxID=183260 RepID=A0ABR2FKN4_9ROSI